jgi:hypothetical protein
MNPNHPLSLLQCREMCRKWYAQKRRGSIRSTNFQLHPPLFRDSNVIRNTSGNLEYPLLFCAVQIDSKFQCTDYNPSVLETGECKLVT